ncbi:MAG TPA: Mut7-C RNAse domain-containing protein [Thermoplasmataceae archaeon]|nr:Mut7-C RNAse domain-containing protein [Thermoplasmatales archaeon AK]HLH85258.1 Mut7-C RNAse domain-containing protein [Thermoplasmataceae archaeon]
MNTYLADSMLGKLCRWLRILGYSVEYVTSDIDDDQIVNQTVGHSSVLLTRDRELSRRYGNAILFDDDDLLKQIRSIVRRDPPDPSLFFTRCPLCNTILEKRDPEDLNGLVPDGVRKRGLDIYHCPKCGKVYWKGSHYDSMLKKIELFLGESGNESFKERKF